MTAAPTCITSVNGAFELRLLFNRLVLEWVGRPPTVHTQADGMALTVGAVGVVLPYHACRQVVFGGGALHLIGIDGAPADFGGFEYAPQLQRALLSFPAAEARFFARTASQRLERYWRQPAPWRWWARQRWTFPGTRAARVLA